jgi:hypothetical protein
MRSASEMKLPLGLSAVTVLCGLGITSTTHEPAGVVAGMLVILVGFVVMLVVARSG